MSMKSSNKKIQWYFLYSHPEELLPPPRSPRLCHAPPTTLPPFPRHLEVEVGPTCASNPRLLHPKGHVFFSPPSGSNVFLLLPLPSLKQTQVQRSEQKVYLTVLPSPHFSACVYQQSLKSPIHICGLHLLTAPPHVSGSTPRYLHHTHFSFLVFIGVYFLYSMFGQLIR